MRGTIGFDHPALPGHFPGEPIVPGVVLLERVIALAEREVAGIPAAKFHTPLRPGEEYVIRLEQARFTVHRGETLIASGSLRFA